MKTRFYMAISEADIVEKLSYEQAGILFHAIMVYEKSLAEGTNPALPEMDLATDIVFTVIKKRLDAEHEGYLQTCANKKKAAEARWKGTDSMQTDAEDMQSDADGMQTDARAYDNDNDIDNDIDKEIEGECEGESLTPQGVVDLYHEICKSHPKVKILTDKRKKIIRTRLRKYTPDDIRMLFEKTKKSRFLSGGNDRGWIADFDWLLKEGNMVKVLEGSYDGKAPPGRKKTVNFEQRTDSLDALFASGALGGNTGGT